MHSEPGQKENGKYSDQHHTKTQQSEHRFQNSLRQEKHEFWVITMEQAWVKSKEAEWKIFVLHVITRLVYICMLRECEPWYCNNTVLSLGEAWTQTGCDIGYEDKSQVHPY